MLYLKWFLDINSRLHLNLFQVFNIEKLFYMFVLSCALKWSDDNSHEGINMIASIMNNILVTWDTARRLSLCHCHLENKVLQETDSRAMESMIKISYHSLYCQEKEKDGCNHNLQWPLLVNDHYFIIFTFGLNTLLWIIKKTFASH